MTWRTFRCLQRFGVWSAITAMILQPQLLTAAEPTAPALAQANAVQAVSVVDVELHQGGALLGQLVDAQGRALAATDIVVANNTARWQTKTDQQGRFKVAGLSGNSYQVAVGQQVQLVRAWAPGTAPPKAGNGLLMVQDNGVVLGQHCASPVCGSAVGAAKHPLAHPLIFGGLVAAAIAIPVAIHNSDDDDPPAS